MSQKFNILLIFAVFSSFTSVFAQSPSGGNDLHINSPYSRVGIGDFSPAGNLRNIGMGGTGVSFGHSEFINSINPALLINNRVTRYDSLLTILEGSGLAQFRRVSNKSASEWSGNVNFNSFAYAFPITKRWTSSIGIHPFSSVSYSLYSKAPVSGSTSDTTLIQHTGFGGIYQADFANGIKINRNLSIGFQASYLFGTINHESLSQILTLPDSLKVGTNERTSYSGLLFRPGVAYRKNMQPTIHADSAIFVNIGFTYDFFGNIKADERLLITRRNSFNTIISQHSAETQSSKESFAPGYRAGLSFNKGQFWNVAADFSYSNWSSYKGVEGDTLKNSFTVSLGGEFAVKRGKDNNATYNLKRNYFRAGLSYTKTPLYINGNQIDDVSLTLGYSFPVGKVRGNSGMPLPKLNTALVIGQRGSYQDSLVKDLYFKVYLGLTINDKWFRRRRIE